MAFGKKAPPKEEARQPDFVIRAKVGDFWQNIGAAWSAKLKDGEGLSIKINVFPAGWDGSALLMPPLPPKEEEKK